MANSEVALAIAGNTACEAVAVYQRELRSARLKASMVATPGETHT